MINVLLEKFNRIHPVSEEFKQRLQEAGYEKKYHAGQIVLPEGQVANNLGFVMSGLVRSYLLIGKDDISTRFMTEGHFITSWYSFFKQQPSLEQIEAMEELVVYCLPYNKLKVICRDFPEFSIISRFFLEYHLYLAEETILMLKQRNAEAKYIFFLQHYPHLLYSISLHAIAGFPGITKETLSRVRSRMQKKKYSL